MASNSSSVQMTRESNGASCEAVSPEWLSGKGVDAALTAGTCNVSTRYAAMTEAGERKRTGRCPVVPGGATCVLYGSPAGGAERPSPAECEPGFWQKTLERGFLHK